MKPFPRSNGGMKDLAMIRYGESRAKAKTVVKKGFFKLPGAKAETDGSTIEAAAVFNKPEPAKFQEEYHGKAYCFSQRQSSLSLMPKGYRHSQGDEEKICGSP
jgi:hypothetical protein